MKCLSFDDSWKQLLFQMNTRYSKHIYEARRRASVIFTENHKNNNGAMQVKLMSPMSDSPKASAEQKYYYLSIF